MLFGWAPYRCCLRNPRPHTDALLLIVSRTLCPITVVQSRNKQLACIRTTYSQNMYLAAFHLPRGRVLENEGTLTCRMSSCSPHHTDAEGGETRVIIQSLHTPHQLLSSSCMENEDECCCGWRSGWSFMCFWH